MRNKNPPCIFKDRYGHKWITADGIRRYFGVCISETVRKFYDYNHYLKGASWIGKFFA